MFCWQNRRAANRQRFQRAETRDSLVGHVLPPKVAEGSRLLVFVDHKPHFPPSWTISSCIMNHSLLRLCLFSTCKARCARCVAAPAESIVLREAFEVQDKVQDRVQVGNVFLHGYSKWQVREVDVILA